MARIVFIGDDFTGASDTLATFAERGASVRLFLDAPDDADVVGLDVVGIATDLRARSPREIARRLGEMAPALRRLSPRFLHYKICSTFDSAPHVGSIGAAVLALEEALGVDLAIVLGGQPGLGRYCAFGSLFARAPDGQTYRIDRHPIMSRHPVTPMAEADIRRHLDAQGLHGLALVDHIQLNAGPGALAKAVAKPGRVLVDAVDQSDVERLGEILARTEIASHPLLLIGASGVAEALHPPSRRPRKPPRSTQGPRLAVAGSRSSTTAAQVEAATSYERLPLGRRHLEADREQVARHCCDLLSLGRNVLIHLQRDHCYELSPPILTSLLAELTASIVHRSGVAAIAVAGGDSSSAVVKRLGFRSLSFVERAAPGVAVCRGHMPGGALDGTLLLLKGGQVGGPDVLERFAAPR